MVNWNSQGQSNHMSPMVLLLKIRLVFFSHKKTAIIIVWELWGLKRGQQKYIQPRHQIGLSYIYILFVRMFLVFNLRIIICWTLFFFLFSFLVYCLFFCWIFLHIIDNPNDMDDYDDDDDENDIDNDQERGQLQQNDEKIGPILRRYCCSFRSDSNKKQMLR